MTTIQRLEKYGDELQKWVRRKRHHEGLIANGLIPKKPLDKCPQPEPLGLDPKDEWTIKVRESILGRSIPKRRMT